MTENTELDPKAEYTFTLTDSVDRDYRFATSISTWLQENIAGLTDDDDNIIFSKVNTGFNSETLKTFGKKPTCDIYINNVEYELDFDIHRPLLVNTILIFYFKGANNHAYNKACELHDYLMQEFMVNENFNRLENLVKETRVTNSRLMSQPINKKWGVMGAFELTHTLY